MTIKSPFFVIQEFLSPLLCEELIDTVDFWHPDTDPDGVPIKTLKSNEKCEELIFEQLQQHVSEIEKHYNSKYQGMTPVIFEWYPESCLGEPHHCENSHYLKQGWVKIHQKDLSGILFLCDYQEKVPFDGDFEVSGGKLEFPQWGFGFNPQRGTLIIFPSGPNFINATTPIKIGDLFQAKFHIVTKVPFMFNREDFQGEYTQWFKHIA